MTSRTFCVLLVALNFVALTGLLYVFNGSNLAYMCAPASRNEKTLANNVTLPNSTQTPQNVTKRKWKLLYKGDSGQVVSETMSPSTADEAYWRFLFHRQYVCEDYIRLGDSFDGGWDVCLVEPYQLKKPCLVYSFGINYDFSFDDAVSIKFGCTVRSFDPSMAKMKDHRRDENIWFYKIGLGGKDEVAPTNKWKLRTLQTLINDFNDTGKIIDYLKIDIEGNEWPSLEAMYKTDVLTRVKQLGMEIHIMPRGTTMPRLFFQRWKSLKRLEEFGFKRWYWHFNFYGAYQYNRRTRTCCYELVYINTKFMSTDARSAKFRRVSPNRTLHSYM